MTQHTPDQIRSQVRHHYGEIAKRPTSERACGCAPSCCASSSEDVDAPRSGEASLSERVGYSKEELQTLPEGADLGLGCGNPQAIASLKAGETVLDLGSGAGMDAFLAAHQVGPTGKVIGVDMTPEMIQRSRALAARSGWSHVDFRLGEIERLPVADSSVDVILSNCVINLSPQKDHVFQEAFRVLKPGGRLAISDVVALAPIPVEMQHTFELLSGCVSGAALSSDLHRWLENAGFVDISIQAKPGSAEVIRDWFPGLRLEEYVTSAVIEARKPTLLSA